VTRTGGAELGPNAQKRADAQLAAELDGGCQLAGVLQRQRRRGTQALRQQGHLDVFAVFVAVADQQPRRRRLGIEGGQRNCQLGLGPHLQPAALGAAKLDQRLAAVGVLVALERKDAVVAPRVSVVRDRALEAGLQPGPAIGQDVGEANQQRRV